MGFRHPQPNNEDDFELFCLRFVRHHWQRPHFVRFGKRGERQYGVDLFDPSGATPVRGVQCKHHEPNKTLPPKEVQDEVDKALGFVSALEDYYILTTAKKSAKAQQKVAAINKEHGKYGRFKVVLWFWEDIESRLDELNDIQLDDVLRGDSNRSLQNLRAVFGPVIQEALESHTTVGASGVIEMELDDAKAAMERHEREVVRYKLDRLDQRHADRLTDRQRYRVHTLRANIAIGLGDWGAAIREVWRRPEPQLTRQAFVFAVLGALRSLRLIGRLRRMTAHLFGLDFVSAADLDECIGIWMECPQSIVLP